MKTFAAAALLMLILARPAWAAQAPAVCKAASPYAGPAPHSPVTVFPSDRLDTSQRVPADVAGKLQSRLGELLAEQRITAASVAIWRPGLGYWSSSVAPPGAPTDRFPVASLTKVATASIILQLVQEGRLSLDQSIDRWFPGFPNGALITVDHLLTHTAGLPEFYTGRGGFADARRYFPPADVVAALAKGGPSPFCPGARYFYSNLDYVMLGLVAEKVDGSALGDLLQARISRPMGLKTFRLLEGRDEASAIAPAGEADTWTAPQIASLAGAAGGVGDAPDMLAMLHGWLDGRLISPASRDGATALLRSDAGRMAGYGRGILVVDLPPPELQTTWIGHTGDVPGYSAVVFYDTVRGAYIAVAVNVQAVAQPVASQMLKALDATAPR